MDLSDVLHPRRGWYSLGRGTTAYAREAVAFLEAGGWQRLGSRRPPEGAEVILAPTGLVDPGDRGRRTRYYVGRWYRVGR